MGFAFCQRFLVGYTWTVRTLPTRFPLAHILRLWTVVFQIDDRPTASIVNLLAHSFCSLASLFHDSIASLHHEVPRKWPRFIA
jgi:hypothetical protein